METVSFKSAYVMLQWNAFVIGGGRMFYTTEEAAIVCGFLDLYLNRDSVDRAVREQNRKFQRSAARGLPVGGKGAGLSPDLLVAVA